MKCFHMTKPCPALSIKMSDIIKYNVAVESLHDIWNHGFDVIIKLPFWEKMYFLKRVVKKKVSAIQRSIS